ncbi:YegS/Rv2252/BmrU family lipid kinase [Diaminobutyricimonas sp. TR449]|uniref:diacylglycerol/lipid kinase family protein n=1 Tax=Diaminobutyricimonas sp. TR449 TaxID=2708076 RepID=UPI00142058D5|nr:YegS/Rv2252/BmrU family lipid kinase [Diaminobutyricimonas sp. TR449]
MASERISRIAVAINPNAAGGRGSAVGAAVVRALGGLGYQVTILQEADLADLEESARRVLGSVDALVVVGGDGMVHFAANLLAGTSVPLGIVPAGTGNDVARGLGIPINDTERAIDWITAALVAGPRRIDAGLVHRSDGSKHWFVGVLSAGFDALVNERANQLRWPKGPARYTLAMLLTLLRFRPIRYELGADGPPTVKSAMLVSVANGNFIGGGMHITPDARFDDGLFDVFVVAPMSKLELIRLFPRVFKGTHVGHRKVTISRARRVTIDAAGVVAYADGERISELPIDVELVPGALALLA